MGSCFSELNLRPKTATSSQSTVVGEEGLSTSPGKIDGALKDQPQRSSDLPKESNDELIAWLSGHLDHPYPSEAEKEDLARQTGLDTSEFQRSPSGCLSKVKSNILRTFLQIKLLVGFSRLVQIFFFRCLMLVGKMPRDPQL